MSSIKEQLLAQVHGLEARRRRLSSRILKLALVCIPTGLASIGLSFMGRSVDPDRPLQDVHVPDALLAKFTEASPLTAASQLAETISALDVASTIGTFATMIFLVYAIFRVVFMAETWTRALQFVIPAALIAGPLAFMNFEMEPGKTYDTSHPAIVAALDKRDYETVSHLLTASNEAQTPAGLYVLAQVALIDGGKSKDTPPVSADVAGKIFAHPIEFGPQLQAVYAIERSAYGDAKSPAAVAFRDKYQREADRSYAASLLLAVLSALLTLGTAGIFVLQNIIRRRLIRIQAAIAPLQTDPAEMDAEHGSPRKGQIGSYSPTSSNDVQAKA